MIEHLIVQNLAIIESAELSFSGGLTVLTGETGAGKSLMIDALELALGERADSELVRTGTDRASVSLTLNVRGLDNVASFLDHQGIQIESDTVIIRRDVTQEGRSAVRLNGKPVPVSTLKELGKLLVDLHGQHHHQALLNPDVHGEYLDAWIGSAAAEASQKVQSCYRQYIATKSRLEVLRTNQRDRAQRLDILRFQFNEIRNFGIRDGELAELEGRISRLQNAEKISASLSMAKEVLRSGEVNAIDLLGQAIHELRVASVFDANITVMLTQIQEYQELLEQSAKEVESFLEENESDPESLEEHAARRDGLKRILKKYGDSEAEVLAHFEQISQELALLEGDGSDESELEKSLEYLTVQLQKACSELTSLREESKSEFARQVVSHLRELSMDRAEVEVAIKPADFGPNGADAIEFMFSANPGEPVKPLTKIASGGEISRVMLAIKCVMAGRAGTPSLLFDEVDTGLGGKAAAAVGKKLAELGRHYQVICISHLPQVASHAQAHLKIEKREVNGRTATSIQLLSEQERVHEIARMLAGETITENALNAAKDMLSLC